MVLSIELFFRTPPDLGSSIDPLSPPPTSCAGRGDQGGVEHRRGAPPGDGGCAPPVHVHGGTAHLHRAACSSAVWKYVMSRAWHSLSNCNTEAERGQVCAGGGDTQARARGDTEGPGRGEQPHRGGGGVMGLCAVRYRAGRKLLCGGGGGDKEAHFPNSPPPPWPP